ncbi:MAG: acyltransferase domain-containing protein, partial [Jatrophihabitantaceae bacterium]
ADKARVGVFVGTSANSYLLRYLQAEPDLEEAFGMLGVVLGNDKDHAATRIAYKLGLTGPAVTVQTSCSTSLVAVHLACQSLLTGDSDLVLAGGASVQLPQHSGYRYEPHGVGSVDGLCRAFDARAGGTPAGNGVGVVALRRAADARADGDTVLALIEGSAINNDGGAKVGYTAPSVAGQAAVVRAALVAAGIAPAEVGYVEAHGTGTEIGDEIEIAALTEAIGPDVARQACAVGSLKPNLGHLDAAAGVASLIRAVQAVRHAVLPPSLCDQPNPAIAWADSPFYVNTEARPWTSARRVCGVSAFGMGGTNAHVVVTSPPAPPEARLADLHRPEVLVRSAATESALAEVDSLLAARLAHTDYRLADVANTLQAGRAPLTWRSASVCGPGDELAAVLATATPRAARRPSPIVLVLPGQGARVAGAADELHRDFPVFAAALDAACLALDGSTDGRLARWLREPAAPDAGPIGTEQSQRGVFALEYATLQMLCAAGVRPNVLVGHSVGEIAAVTAAGGFDLASAAALLTARSAAMTAAPAGRMVAVRGDVARLAECPAFSRVVTAVIDGPNDLVLAGDEQAVEAVTGEARAVGLQCAQVAVGHAFHSPDMAAAAGAVGRFAATVPARPLTVPVCSTVTGTVIPAGAQIAPEHWADQLVRPVLFGAALGRALTGNDPLVVEVGPSGGLLRLARRALHPAPQTLGTASGAATRRVLGVAAAAWCRGLDIDWSVLRAAGPRRRVELPVYPFARDRHWLGAPSRPEPTAGPTELPATPVVTMESEVGRELSSLWQRLLGCTVPGVDDDFVDAGGDSLIASRMLVALRSRFRTQLTLSELSRSRTFGAQVRLVEQAIARD